MDVQNRFKWPVRPCALQENVVAGAKYRFSVLTSRLIRLEYSAAGEFEDRASQSVFYRDFPSVSYNINRENGILTLETEHLVLTYTENEVFSGESLTLRMKQEPASGWRYGDDFEDLGGTTKTLDTVNGECAVERGVVSRNGFSVMDDSHTLVLEDDGWVGVRKDNTTDVYFFGYGFDYIAAVQDLYRLTGIPAMLPAYALGNWWSRYHAYTQQEYSDLVDRFRQEDVPFSVGVVDMDWHIVNIPKEDQDPELPGGWTGYSWNKELFPDYKAFLRFLKERNLHTALNLHPADGIRRHEDMYQEFAEAMGIDPETRQRIPFDILSQKFMAHYFDIIHHPYEADGVDFWWMDWQQGTNYWWIHEANKPGEYLDPRERLDPLWMLNHLHILDITRDGKRPIFFSRYSGPGSQRYPVGFSGDTLVTWESLDFQPYFTATATNVGYTAWSHDIGGHMCGYRDDELQVRWLQLGVLSPVNRLHSSNSQFMSKEPWCYGAEAQAIMKDWLRLRHSLFPYLYTMNYRTHAELLPLVQPMYYSHPKCQAAYDVPNQYWFGSELIVAPITEPMNPYSRMGKTKAWLPKGDWFDFFSGVHYFSRRGRKMNLHRYLDTIPVLAKAGAIVPMAQYAAHDNRLLNAENMNVAVFPGANNSFTLYEDAGDYSDYQNGAFAKTNLDLQWGSEAVFTIHPAEGDLTLIPGKRNWKISLRGFHKDAAVSVNVAGAQVERIDKTNTTEVCVTADVTDTVIIRITGEKLIHDNAEAMDRCRDIILFSQISDKDQMLNTILSYDTIHKQLWHISGHRREWDGVADAIKEMLTLTQEEYENASVNS